VPGNSLTCIEPYHRMQSVSWVVMTWRRAYVLSSTF